MDDKEIVKSLTLHAADNAFVGIVGPNGCGKSTFLKTVYRVLKPKAGTVFLDDANALKMSYRQSAQKLAVVAQHNHQDFDFTVGEVVMMGRAPHKRALERDHAEDFRIVNDALDRVQMGTFKERLFASLSGGEQQRVILARALAQKTQCLILDEPTNHLDIKYQLQMLELVKSMKMTVVAAIHDLNLAMMYCDYVYIMDAGRIVGHGKPEDALTEAMIEKVYGVRVKHMTDPESGCRMLAFLPSNKTHII
nr:ABC transporter ATP-binding protein [Fusibacter paucivorans]